MTVRTIVRWNYCKLWFVMVYCCNTCVCANCETILQIECIWHPRCNTCVCANCEKSQSYAITVLHVAIRACVRIVRLVGVGDLMLLIVAIRACVRIVSRLIRPLIHSATVAIRACVRIVSL